MIFGSHIVKSSTSSYTLVKYVWKIQENALNYLSAISIRIISVIYL